MLLFLIKKAPILVTVFADIIFFLLLAASGYYGYDFASGYYDSSFISWGGAILAVIVAMIFLFFYSRTINAFAYMITESYSLIISISVFSLIVYAFK